MLDALSVLFLSAWQQVSLYHLLCLLARPNSCFREQYSTISKVFVTSCGDFEGKDVFPGRSIDVKRAKTLPQLASRHDHLIAHQHLGQLVQPIAIEVVPLLDSLDALTQQSIRSLQSIFVEPEDVDVFGGTGCIGEEEHVGAPYSEGRAPAC
jgi:hypothetical protein